MYIFTFCSNICADNIISHENKYYIKKECKIHAFSLLVSECATVLRVYWFTVMTVAEALFLGTSCVCICPYACLNAINMF